MVNTLFCMYYCLSDSSSVYNNTEDDTHREHVEDFGTPDIHNKTLKPDDFTVLNDISEEDDLILCEMANLPDSSNYFVGRAQWLESHKHLFNGIYSMAYSTEVTILACEQFDSTKATKSVCSYVCSKACKDVTFFMPVFSFKWIDSKSFFCTQCHSSR